MLGRTVPEEVLARALYATPFTLQIDRHGFVRFKHWKFYGERGLSGENVSVWVYEGNLKVGYQATALAFYELGIEKKTGGDYRSEESTADGNALPQPANGSLADLGHRMAVGATQARAGCSPETRQSCSPGRAAHAS